MLLSMTGFGQAHRETDRYTATVELRSLNSKTLDLSLRLPRFLQSHELEIRQQITKVLLRGKVNFSLDYSRPTTSAATTPALNREALVAVFHELQAVAHSLGLPTTDVSADLSVRGMRLLLSTVLATVPKRSPSIWPAAASSPGPGISTGSSPSPSLA